MQLVALRRLAKFTVELDDVVLIDAGLASNIEKNAFRYTKLFSEAVDKLLPPPNTDILTEDVFDVIQAHRLKMIQEAAKEQQGGAEAAPVKIEDHFPPVLFRRFEVRFAPRTDVKADSLRNVVATDLGKLVTVKCIVVRASDIKPICVVATYTCDQCGYELYQEVSCCACLQGG